MTTIECLDCGQFVELTGGETHFICDRCHAAQRFLTCDNCSAVSQVPDTMGHWSCTECGAEISNHSSRTATAMDYIRDLRVEHSPPPEEPTPHSYGLRSHHHGAPPRGASRATHQDGRLMFLIPCPICPSETPVEPQAKVFECGECGMRLRLARCEACEAIWPVDDVLGAWTCPSCQSENRVPGNANSVTAEEYADLLTQADLSEQ